MTEALLDWDELRRTALEPAGGAPAAHCSVCGRFARFIPGSARQDWQGEWDTGKVTCSVHGRQDASWPA